MNGIDDLVETVRVILDKAVEEISQETQSSSTPVVVCESEGKRAPKYQISQQQLANGYVKQGKGVEDFSNKRGVVGIFKNPLTSVMNENLYFIIPWKLIRIAWGGGGGERVLISFGGMGV